MSGKNDDIRAILEARLESLRDQVSAMEETLREPDDDDFEEQAVDLDDEEVLGSLSSAGRAEMQLIQAALRRLDDGTYGTCVTCGRSISEGRLRALPEAAQCVDCAQKSSKRQQ